MRAMQPTGLSAHGLPSRRGLAAAVALAALVAGCALKPPPAHEATVRAAVTHDTKVPDEWVAGGIAGPVANGWLAELNDPAAAAIVAEAIANNTDLREAAARVQAAQQAAVVAGSRMLPWVGAVAGGNVTHDDGGHTNESSEAYVTVAWEADVWGMLRARRASAEASARAATLDYAWARQSLAATAARLWYLNTEANQLVALGEQAVAVYQQLVDLVQIRTTYGKVSNLDLAFTRAKLESAQSDLQSARAAQGEARRGLEILLGRYPAAEIQDGSRLPGVDSAAVRRRPGITAAAQA